MLGLEDSRFEVPVAPAYDELDQSQETQGQRQETHQAEILRPACKALLRVERTERKTVIRHARPKADLQDPAQVAAPTFSTTTSTPRLPVSRWTSREKSTAERS